MRAAIWRWRSAADNEKTGKALFAMPGVGGWIRSLDFRRFTVLRGDELSTAPAIASPNPRSAQRRRFAAATRPAPSLPTS